MKSRIFPFIFTISIFIASCEKFVTVDPPTASLVSETVYTSNGTAAAAVTSIYSRLSSSGLSTGNTSISMLTGVAADELIHYSSNLRLSQFYSNSLSSTDVYFWPELYQQLYVTNAVLEGLERSSAVSNAIKQQLVGEARFIRAFLLFYATNLYGDVPLVTTTDYRVNNALSRSASSEVYDQIVADLTAAKDLLSDKYLSPTGTTTNDRVRPNKSAAQAMLARVYLYTKKWSLAEANATAVINNTANYNLVTDLTKVFLTSSKEALWQLQPVVPGYNTQDAFYFVLTSIPGSERQPVSLRTNLVNSFEPADKRLTNWVANYKATPTGTTYYYPFKYKVYTVSSTQPVTEAVMVLRLAEQYLIRAEARAHQDNIFGALADLNAIRARAGLVGVSAPTQAATLTAIYRERQLEMFTEWGHRWFDLKRTLNIDAVMDTVTPSKGGVWKTTSQYLPIPNNELLINPKLTQNEGY